MVGPPPETWAVPAEKGRAFELTEGLWRLRLPLPWPGIGAANAYALARADGGLTLVDCGGGGDPSTWVALETAVRSSGHELDDIREIVITHYHSDHTGTLGWLVEQTGAHVVGHPAHAHFTDGAERPGELSAARRRRAAVEGVPEDRVDLFGDMSEELDGIDGPVHPDRPVRDGDTVASVHGDWRVIETPGHAPSHICLWQPDHRLLVTGDLVSAEFHPWFDYGYSADPVAETFDSLQRLRKLGEPALTLPGHGRPLDDLPAVVQAHIDGIVARLESMRAALRSRSATAYQMTGVLFGELSEIDLVLRFTEALSYLGHLRRQGKVTRELTADGIHVYLTVA
jgi:glyoxylase-like metal-dependent hydrolase (beta-lactamase superfamily II)